MQPSHSKNCWSKHTVLATLQGCHGTTHHATIAQQKLLGNAPPKAQHAAAPYLHTVITPTRLNRHTVAGSLDHAAVMILAGS
jgi:hypothetical protein